MTHSLSTRTRLFFFKTLYFRLGWYISLEICRKVVLFELVGITRKFLIKMDRPHTCKLLNENHMGFRLHICCS